MKIISQEEEERIRRNVKQLQHETKKCVKKIMQTHPQTRNNDTLLLLKLWEKHDLITINIPDELAWQLTNPKSVFRTRREIQNQENKLLPTTPGVLTKRRISEDAIKEYYTKKGRADVWKKYKQHRYEPRQVHI